MLLMFCARRQVIHSLLHGSPANTLGVGEDLKRRAQLVLATHLSYKCGYPCQRQVASVELCPAVKLVRNALGTSAAALDD